MAYARMKVHAAAVLAALALCTVAHAQKGTPREHTWQRSTTAGQEVRIFTYVQQRSDCSQGPDPVVTIRTKPAHGTVSVRPGSVTVGPPRFGAVDCSGRTLSGQGIWFVPEPGFSGTDQFDYEVQFTNGVAHDTAMVEVKP
ncbi:MULTISPECIES: Ig-like domain-containing protein [unclassified Variovorax]|uniref:Ig-like domain-containing protein n=1 Tax=unclassified Variovorax TaxID=663243 RepID=UPI00131BBA3F|nr:MULTISPECIES: Ig-like domain-containing protein [unclassified Variovorax]QRY33289.1 hypothetical protein JVX96_08315 [Variovorax sp. PDNC026]